jgi:fatty acid desaturase
VLAAHVAMPAVAFYAGWGMQYLVLWVLPLATGLQAILRLRAICEHGALSDFSSPLTAARTHAGGMLQRLFLFPHHVGYHIEHHLYPAVPHYHLPALHAALMEHGILEGAEVRTLGETIPRIFAEPLKR